MLKKMLSKVLNGKNDSGENKLSTLRWSSVTHALHTHHHYNKHLYHFSGITVLPL